MMSPYDDVVDSVKVNHRVRGITSRRDYIIGSRARKSPTRDFSESMS